MESEYKELLQEIKDHKNRIYTLERALGSKELTISDLKVLSDFLQKKKIDEYKYNISASVAMFTYIKALTRGR